MEIKHRTELKKLMPKRKLTGAEIGVASGLHSNDILMNWNIKKLYLIDAWECMPNQLGDASSPQEWHDFNYKSTVIIMKNHGSKYKILRGLSTAMSKTIQDETLDFIYIDGDHSYEGVMKDLQAWCRKVKKNGLISGHDYKNVAYGVYEAVHDFCKDNNFTPVVIPEHKAEDAGFYFIKT